MDHISFANKPFYIGGRVKLYNKFLFSELNRLINLSLGGIIT